MGFRLIQLCLMILTLLHGGTLPTTTTASFFAGNETDCLALLAFKSKITHDPYGVVSSWNNSLHFCEWQGVGCGHRHKRVTIIDLESKGLVGALSPYLGNLTFLRWLNLQNNTFQEYGLGGEISTNGDSYSYGILLLEMMTGKRPTDSMFEEGLSLHSFAKMALPNHVMEIADPMLNKKEKMARSTIATTADAINNTWAPIQLNNGSGMVEFLISIVMIGVACSMESPQGRMSISNILHELHLMKNKLLQDKHLTRTLHG